MRGLIPSNVHCFPQMSTVLGSESDCNWRMVGLDPPSSVVVHLFVVQGSQKLDLRYIGKKSSPAHSQPLYKPVQGTISISTCKLNLSG